MHELSLVEELLTECKALAQGRTVEVVSARCSSAIDTVELSEGFALLAGQVAAGPGGDACLRKARLKLETVPVYFQCACGFNGELAADHVAGHVGICPACGQVSEVGVGVELVAMTFSEPGRGATAARRHEALGDCGPRH